MIGLTFQELKNTARKGMQLRKVLTSHILADKVKTLVCDRKMEVIPIELHYSDQMKRDLSRIKANSSVLRILPPYYLRYASFIRTQLQKYITASGVNISFVSGSNRSLDQLLRRSKYDVIIVDPLSLARIPEDVQTGNQILPVRLELDLKSLEAARIRAGVIV